MNRFKWAAVGMSAYIHLELRSIRGSYFWQVISCFSSMSLILFKIIIDTIILTNFTFSLFKLSSKIENLFNYLQPVEKHWAQIHQWLDFPISNALEYSLQSLLDCLEKSLQRLQVWKNLRIKKQIIIWRKDTSWET